MGIAVIRAGAETAVAVAESVRGASGTAAARPVRRPAVVSADFTCGCGISWPAGRPVSGNGGAGFALPSDGRSASAKPGAAGAGGRSPESPGGTTTGISTGRSGLPRVSLATPGRSAWRAAPCASGSSMRVSSRASAGTSRCDQSARASARPTDQGISCPVPPTGDVVRLSNRAAVAPAIERPGGRSAAVFAGPETTDPSSVRDPLAPASPSAAAFWCATASVGCACGARPELITLASIKPLTALRSATGSMPEPVAGSVRLGPDARRAPAVESAALSRVAAAAAAETRSLDSWMAEIASGSGIGSVDACPTGNVATSTSAAESSSTIGPASSAFTFKPSHAALGAAFRVGSDDGVSSGFCPLPRPPRSATAEPEWLSESPERNVENGRSDDAFADFSPTIGALPPLAGAEFGILVISIGCIIFPGCSASAHSALIPHIDYRMFTGGGAYTPELARIEGTTG